MANQDDEKDVQSKEVKALLDRGIAQLRNNQYVEALQTLTEAIRLDPTDADFYYQRGVAYCRLNDYPHAVTDLKEAIRLEPTDANFYYQRGFAYFQIGRYLASYHLSAYQDALKDTTEAIRLEPTDVYFYIQRGLIYEELRDYQNALADFEMVNQLEPADECDKKIGELKEKCKQQP